MIAQVVALTLRPGIDGEIEQELMVPLVVAVCDTVTPSVSTTVEGE